jgi:hypothetical protein
MLPDFLNAHRQAKKMQCFNIHCIPKVEITRFFRPFWALVLALVWVLDLDVVKVDGEGQEAPWHPIRGGLLDFSLYFVLN